MLLRRLKNPKKLVKRLDATAAAIRHSRRQRQADGPKRGGGDNSGSEAARAGTRARADPIGSNSGSRGSADDSGTTGNDGGGYGTGRGVTTPADDSMRPAPAGDVLPAASTVPADASSAPHAANAADAQAAPRVGSGAGDAAGDSGDACSGMITAEDIKRLDDGELADLDRLVWIAQYVATRHADKKELRDLMEPIVSAIKESADEIGAIQDDVHGMLLSAETSLGTLKEMRANVCADPTQRGAMRNNGDAASVADAAFDTIPPDMAVPAYAESRTADSAQRTGSPASGRKGPSRDTFCRAAPSLRDDVEIGD